MSGVFLQVYLFLQLHIYKCNIQIFTQIHQGENYFEIYWHSYSSFDWCWWTEDICKGRGTTNGFCGSVELGSEGWGWLGDIGVLLVVDVEKRKSNKLRFKIQDTRVWKLA